MTEDALNRIAAALERLSPPPLEPADPLAHRAYVWRDNVLSATAHFEPVPLELLTGIDRQKTMLLENSTRLARRAAAHDVLLWGARGSGKSMVVKSGIAKLQDDDDATIALVEVAPDRLASLPNLFTALADADRAFVVFIDDIGFDDDVGAARALRSLLEGGAEARPSNVRLYVTSNRRHILPRSMAEQNDPINPRDARDDSLALADRFGLSLGFHACDQADYLAIIAAYAEHYSLTFQEAEALEWAKRRGGRSGRVAWQFVVELAGRMGRTMVNT